MISRKMGWIRDLPDHRDLKYKDHSDMKNGMMAVPISIDLRSLMSPVEDQGQLGSCVANATVGSLEFLELQELRLKSGGVETFPDGKFDDISRLYVYYNARALDGDVNQDAGTSLRSAVRAIQNWGICRESIWPYSVAKVFAAPPATAYKEGATHLVLNHYGINNAILDQLFQCLILGNPFIFGMSLYQSFMSQDVAKTGMVPMPTTQEQFVGGHALCCVGYDFSKNGGSFIVRNSWGTLWGEQGYCYIPFSYLTNLDLASDFWTLRKE